MGIITDMLKEIPLSAVLREKIIALENEMTNLKVKDLALNAELQKANFTIKQQNEKIQTLEKLLHNSSEKYSGMRWGCLLFAGDKRLYCPSCFHKNGKKIETSRLDSHNRFCSVCKTTIPSG